MRTVEFENFSKIQLKNFENKDKSDKFLEVLLKNEIRVYNISEVSNLSQSCYEIAEKISNFPTGTIFSFLCGK